VRPRRLGTALEEGTLLFRIAAPVQAGFLLASFVAVEAYGQTISLKANRAYHTATVLNDGRVLLAGGLNGSVNAGTALSSAEVYTPVAGSTGLGAFSATGSMTTPRELHAAILLQDGRVLIVGGRSSNNGPWCCSPVLASAEIYDPATGVFTATGSMTTARYDPTATVLADGRVLVTGGADANYAVINSAEIYDPATGLFTPTGNMQQARMTHSATRLNSGQVLIAGGGPLGSGGVQVTATAELFDPKTGLFTATPNMQAQHGAHTATLLNNGKVLLAGGVQGGWCCVTNQAELYDPTTGAFTTTGSMAVQRYNHSATLLTNGLIFIAGGGGGTWASTEIYDPVSGTFSPGPAMTTGRWGNTSTLLTNGSVLLAGGGAQSAEAYAPASLVPAGLQSIAVAPSPSNPAQGLHESFVATGSFGDGSTQILQSVIWSTGDPTAATISNDVTGAGIASVLGQSTTTVQACAGSICGSAPLQSLLTWVSPTLNLLHGASSLAWGAGAVGTGATVTILISGKQSFTLGSNLPATSSFSWDTTTVPDGQYQLRLVLQSAGGTTLQQVSRTFVVNNSVIWHSGTVASSQTWTAAQVHVIAANVVIPAGVTLTISPGTIIKVVQGAQIVVQSGGILNALGTSSQPILFTVWEDDSAGGDTNLDGSQSVPVPGEWGGISTQGSGQFNANGFTTLRYLQTLESGTITANQTWPGSQTYQLTGTVTVPSGVTLTIQPGAVVKFAANAGIVVQPGGTLIANGAVAQPIYFTSIKDDSIGGDTNGDGNTTSPAPGDWGTILIDGGTASFDHVQMQYGGGPINSSDVIGMVQSSGAASVTISNSVLAQVYSDGVVTGYPNAGGAVSVTSTVLNGIEGRGINAWPGSTVHVINDTFDKNAGGVIVHGGSVDVANSIISGSGSWGGIYLCCGGTLASVSYTDVWSNVPGALPNYVNTSDLTGAQGNISANPGFRNEAQGDLRLNYGSPAIDAANGAVAPATDLMGSPRANDPATAHKTGVAAANGAYPDMGAYEFSAGAPSNVDLTVTSVTGPVTATAGSQVQINWSVTNIGTGTAIGPWHDSIYLVRNPDTNPVAILASQMLVGSGVTIGPGATYNASATIRVPGSIVANHRWEVQTNTAGDIFEGQNTANNTGVSLQTVAIDVPALPLDSGSLSNSFTAAGQSWWYKIAPGANKAVTVTLGLAGNTGTVQLFIGAGYVPTAQSYDFQQQQFNSAIVSAVIPNTSTQTYYVTAYAQSLTGSQAAFTISAASQQFSLTSVQPNSIVNSGTATIEFIGALLSSSATYQLVASNGTAYTASPVFAVDSSHVYATFNAAKLAAGSYSARVIQNGITLSLNAALTVTAAPAGPVSPIQYSLEVPPAVRAGYGGAVTIHYKNTGSTDVAAPLMVLNTSGGSSNFVPPVCTGCSANFAALFTTMAGQGQFLGISPTGPAGVLSAGASGSLSLNFTSSISASAVNFNLYNVPDPMAPINWSSVSGSMQPSWAPSDAWAAIFGNFTAAVGSTWGSYNTALAADATYLSQLGKQEYRVSQLQMFELTKAGLNTIAQRYFLGAFGRGGSHPFDISVETVATGLLVHYPSGTVRPFVPDPNNVGQYTGGVADHAIVAASGGGLLLTEQSGIVYHFVPGAAGRLVLDYIQDLNGNRVTVNYTNGLVTSVVDSTGDAITYTYNGQGRIAQMTDAVGRVTTYGYDADGQHLLTVTNARGTVSLAYVSGQGAAQEHAIQSVTHADGTHTFYQYDSKGRAIKIYRDGNAQTVILSYAPSGAVTIADALGNVSHVAPDEYGSLAQYTDPLGNLTQASFDAEGKTVRGVGADGASASVDYDDNGNPTASRDPLGNQLATQFAGNGSLLSLTDTLGNTTRYGYDTHFNATALTYPDGRAEKASYDSRGNLTSWTNRRGQTITYTYNSKNLLTQKTRSNGAIVTYAYDSHRNLQTVTDSTGTISFTYDSGDRLSGVTYPNGRFLRYTYDSGGRRSSLSDNTGFVVNYSYDGVGRLSQVTSGGSNPIASYTYDANGRLSQKNLGNGAYTTYAYDAAGHVLHLVNYSGSGNINSRFDYTYDAAGRKITMTTLDGLWKYGYDASGQLTSVVQPNGTMTQYNYDAAGNRTSVVSGGVTTNYSVNNLNEYTSVGGGAYTYDADGNLMSKQSGGAWTYTYDDENRLIGVIGPSGNWTYQYDALGNRTASSNGGTTTQYLVDPTGIGTVTAEFGAVGLVEHFTYGLDLTSAVPVSGNADFYQFDGSGNTTTVTSLGGGVSNAYSYLPFGEKVKSIGTASNPFTFVGKFGVMDEGLGLYHMHRRWYDSASGRFNQPDPVRFGGGDTNWYRYARNRPANYVDPSGTDDYPPEWNIDCGEESCNDLQNQAVLQAIGDQFQPPQYAHVGVAAGNIDKSYYINLRNGNVFDSGGATTARVPSVTATVGWIAPDSGLPASADDVDNCLFGASLSASVSYGLAVGGLRCSSAWGGELGIGSPSNPAVAGSIGNKAFTIPPSEPTSSQETPDIGSIDPNAKMTVGFGTQGFISSDATITYTITFENESSATAAAQKVVVTDSLSANLDWSTVRLSQIGFNNVTLNVPSGLQSYSMRTSVLTDPNPVTVSASLNPGTGVLTWTIQSVDPVTGGIPANPLAGFLPPNNASHPGDGFVSFTVKPRAGLANATAITNQASIVFDLNAAIPTNAVTNTIDSVYPTSSVSALPAISASSSFTVSWSGSDPGGAGIASYDIYVSTDNGPYTVWLAATTLTSSTFTGAPGHRYSFYSMATDNIGHRQLSPGASQTTTTAGTAVCAADDTRAITMKQGGFVYVPSTGRFTQTATLTNNSAATISGPISLVLDNLSTAATLFNAAGTTSCAAPLGSSYASSAADLPAGQSVSLTLQFTDPTKAAISYLPRVLAGTGSR
jgi:RHS repeat-associated protein/uncharacterized repeat protein (TIGR01451 family)